jgi:predicted secreted Zn-dependent protease
MTFYLKSALVLCLAAAAGLAHVPSTQAETVITKTFAYFPVRGTTAADLDEALSRGGPLLQSTGNRHPGATEMKFGGSVTYSERPGRCGVDSARITLDTKIILPRWTQRRRADRDLAMIWDTLSGDIKRHEERHAEIAREYARKLESSVEGLRPQADCAAMEAAVARTTEQVLAEHDRDQARFDRVESINFERRMVRLMEYRLQQLRAAE